MAMKYFSLPPVAVNLHTRRLIFRRLYNVLSVYTIEFYNVYEFVSVRNGNNIIIWAITACSRFIKN